MTMREKRKGEKFMNKMNSKQRIIMESDAINLEQLEYKIHQQALFDINQNMKLTFVIYLVGLSLILQKRS